MHVGFEAHVRAMRQTATFACQIEIKAHANCHVGGEADYSEVGCIGHTKGDARPMGETDGCNGPRGGHRRRRRVRAANPRAAE